MPLTAGIDLPSGGAGWPSGFLSTGRPLPAGWETGIEFRAIGCAEPVVSAQCATFSDVPTEVGAPVKFAPFTIRQSAICSTLSGRFDGLAADRLAYSTEWALGNELATGTVTGNPALADADVVDGSGGDNALACLLGAAADAGFGTPFTLHVNMRALPAITGLGFDRTNWLDAIIVSPGYPNTEAQVWVTGPVFRAVTTPVQLDDVDHRRNSFEDWAQREAIVAFDPCLNLSAVINAPCAAA